MITTYPARYKNMPVSIILSPVTLTIRYKDENNQQQDLHWLGSDLQELETTPASYILHHHSGDTLYFTDPALLQAFKKNYRHLPVAGNKRYRFFSASLSGLFNFGMVVVAIACLYLFCYFKVAPWLGQYVANKTDKSVEIANGTAMYAGLITQYKIDSTKTRILNEFFKACKFPADYPVQITVVQEAEENAFAIPGGHIVVYDGILDKMKQPEELAALLAHEVSHITLRHSISSLYRELSGRMFLSLVFGRANGITSTLVSNADMLKNLHLSKQMETDADNNGIKLMAASKINTQGMSDLMVMLEKTGTGESRAPIASYLSTHPLFDKRMNNIREQLKTYPPATTEDPQLQPLFHSIYESY